MKLLEYSPEVLQRLEAGELLLPGNELEAEIRGCSIHAVEQLMKIVRQRTGADVNSVILDFYLWDYAKASQTLMAHIPVHHVRSIFY